MTDEELLAMINASADDGSDAETFEILAKLENPDLTPEEREALLAALPDRELAAAMAPLGDAFEESDHAAD